MVEHLCSLCDEVVPVLGGEFVARGRWTEFVCVDCLDDNYESPTEQLPPKHRPNRRRTEE